MRFDPNGVLAFSLRNPVIVVAGLVLALVVLAIMWRAGRGLSRVARRGLSGKRPEDVLTFIVAAIATAGAAQGNFKFFGDKLAMPFWMQWLTFAMFELGMLTCALRARRKIRNPQIGTAGVDGVLVWVISSVSAVLASSDANGWGVLGRLVFPFFAASMWELLLAFERRRVGRSTINWKITPEKLLVRLGLAEASHRSTGEVDTHRRLKTVALAAHRLGVLQGASAAKWRTVLARRRLDTAMRSLVEFTDFTKNHSLQEELVTMIAALNGAASLANVSEAPPWERPDPVSVVFEDARPRFASLISGTAQVGTGRHAEIGTGAGTDGRYTDEADTGTAGTGDTGEDGTGTGTEDRPRDERPVPRTRRRAARRTGTKPRGDDGRAVQLERARELNTAHMREHGRPISGDRLAAELHVSKTTALDLLREVKRPREVRPADGVA